MTIDEGQRHARCQKGSTAIKINEPRVTIDKGNDTLEIQTGNLSIKAALGKIEWRRCSRSR